MSFFQKGRRKSISPVESGIEMETLKTHVIPSRDGHNGRISHKSGSYTDYERENDAMTIHTISSAKSGEGAKMMHDVATEARTADKDFVRTTLTAPTAHGFYLKMGLHPAPSNKAHLDTAFRTTTLPLRKEVALDPEVKGPSGEPIRRFKKTDLDQFAQRLKAGQRSPTWEGRASTVRELSTQRK